MRIVISIALAAALGGGGCGSKSSDQGSGGSDKKEEGQSFAEAMQIACDAPDAIPDGKPADRIAAAMKQADPKITNKEVRDLFASFASNAGIDKRTAMHEAIRKARLNHCTLAELFSQL